MEQVDLAKVRLIGTVRRCGVISISAMVTQLTGATKTLIAPEANPILMTPYGVIRVIDLATQPLRVMQPPSWLLKAKEHHHQKVVSIKAQRVIATGKARTFQQATNPNKPHPHFMITRLLPLPKSGGNPMS